MVGDHYDTKALPNHALTPKPKPKPTPNPTPTPTSYPYPYPYPEGDPVGDVPR